MGAVRPIVQLGLKECVAALARIPLLAGCPEDELADIAARSHLLRFMPDEVVIPEGEEALGFYLILDGEVAVSRGGAQVAHLGAGAFFGEIALLEGGARRSTVTATTEVTCIGILRSFFRPMLVRNPRLAMRILDEERRRLDANNN